MTRGLAAEPDRFEGRSRYNSLSLSGRPSGWLADRTNSDDFEGACPVEIKFLLENSAIDAFTQSLSDGDGGLYIIPSHRLRVWGGGEACPRG